MVSELAREDIEALLDEGCIVRPEDVIRLNALGLKLEKRPDFRLATLPRIALCGDTTFVQPTIEQELFLDSILPLFSKDEGTMIALEAYVLAHQDEDWSKRKMFPRLFAAKCAVWIKKHLGKETVGKVQAALDYVKYGMNPMDGEFPVYVKDDKFEKWYYDGSEKSTAMKRWSEACACGIAPYAALKATSERLLAMIERAWYLKQLNIEENEKVATAEYFATLHEIQEKVRAERDSKKKPEETKPEKEEVNENG